MGPSLLASRQTHHQRDRRGQPLPRPVRGGIITASLVATQLISGLTPALSQTALPQLTSTAQSNRAESRGQSLYQSGDYNAAITAWQRAAQSHASQNHWLGQARALNNMAIAQQQQGDWGGARVTLSTSEALLAGLDTTAAKAVQAQALYAQAYLHYNLGDRQAALRTWQQAADHYQAAQDVVGQWQSQLAIAQTQQSLGQASEALEQVETINQALDKMVLSEPGLSEQNKQLRQQPSIHKSNLQQLRIQARRQWGDMLRTGGKLDPSQQRLEEALALAQASTPPATHPAVTTTNKMLQGQLWLSLGHTARAHPNLAQQARAEAFYNQAAAIEDTEIQARLALMTLWSEQRDANLASSVSRKNRSGQRDNTAKIQETWSRVQTLLKTAPPQRRHLYSRIQLIYQLEQPSIEQPSTPGIGTSEKSIAGTEVSTAFSQRSQRRSKSIENDTKSSLNADTTSSIPSPEDSTVLLEALAYESVQQAYALDNAGAIAPALGALAHLHSQQQQWDKAQSLTEEAIQLAKTHQNVTVLYPLQGQLAHQHLAQFLQSNDDAASREGSRKAAIEAYTAVLQTLKTLAQPQNSQQHYAQHNTTWQEHQATYETLIARLNKLKTSIGPVQHRQLQALSLQLKRLELTTLLSTSPVDVPAPMPVI